MWKFGRLLLLLVLFLFACGLTGCSIFGGEDEGPVLPENPVERAAVLGLINSYRESTMWEIRDPEVRRTQPVVPTKWFVQEHDPKELYCVCVQYEARYKVPWTTKDRSPWERSVRNILVIKTKADNYMAMRPSAICSPICE